VLRGLKFQLVPDLAVEQGEAAGVADLPLLEQEAAVPEEAGGVLFRNTTRSIFQLPQALPTTSLLALGVLEVLVGQERPRLPLVRPGPLGQTVETAVTQHSAVFLPGVALGLEDLMELQEPLRLPGKVETLALGY